MRDEKYGRQKPHIYFECGEWVAFYDYSHIGPCKRLRELAPKVVEKEKEIKSFWNEERGLIEQCFVKKGQL